MSQENVELLRTVYQAVNRGDWDAAFREAPSNFELKTADNNPIAGTYRGRDEVQRFFEEFWAAFAEVDVQPERFVVRDDRILALLRMRLRPTDSDAILVTRLAHVWTVCEGAIVRCEVFTELEDAFKAAGLSEQDAYTGPS